VKGAQIWIKPLRDRPEAIAPLVQAIIAAKADKLGREPRSFTEDALAYLRTLSLPGNVRELEKVVVRALLQDRSDGVDREEVERLLSERRVPHQPQHEPTADDTVGNPRDRLELGRFLTQCERYEAATPAFRAGTEALAKVLQTEMLAYGEDDGSLLFKSLKIPPDWIGFELTSVALAAVMGWDMSRVGLDPARRRDRIQRYGATWGKAEAQLGALHRRVLEHLGVHRIDQPIY
jgi:hypothetical protein